MLLYSKRISRVVLQETSENQNLTGNTVQ